MGKGKLVQIGDLRLKFRSRDGFGTAEVWMEGKRQRTIATFDLDLAEHPGDPMYQGWVEHVTKAFQAMIERRTGIALQMPRRKPDYKGERRQGDG